MRNILGHRQILLNVTKIVADPPKYRHLVANLDASLETWSNTDNTFQRPSIMQKLIPKFP